jgi:uncharacterized protein
VIFVDANVVMYAVGAAHPVQAEIQQRIVEVDLGQLATSAEVMQELLHHYIRTQRWVTLDRAFTLVRDRMTVWGLDADDVMLARRLADRHPALTARDLVHLAVCLRRDASELWTYDRGLAAAWKRR